VPVFGFLAKVFFSQDFDDHKAKHDKFVKDCLAVKEVNKDVIAFLKQWLVSHITVSDKEYAGKI